MRQSGGTSGSGGSGDGTGAGPGGGSGVGGAGGHGSGVGIGTGLGVGSVGDVMTTSSGLAHDEDYPPMTDDTISCASDWIRARCSGPEKLSA